MSPERSSRRIQPQAQRRPRTERACNFCRLAKQRCEPTEYGTNDRPCRRCVLHGLECNLSRATRSQSPSSGPSVHGPGPIQHLVVPPSASGPNEELMLNPEANVQYAQQPDPVPMGRWPMLIVHPEERQGSSADILAPEQIAPGTLSYAPHAPAIEGYRQSYAIPVQGHTDPGLGYYPQGYYEHATASNHYMTGYVTQSANDGETIMRYAVEGPQPSDDGGYAGEQVFRPDGL